MPKTMPLSAASRQPAIDDYAIIGDCRTAALISRNGSIDWLCLPDFSSPSVFAALLDMERGGHFRIRPSGEFRCRRRYLHDAPVLENTFESASGVFRLIDLMPIHSGVVTDSLPPQRELLRIIRAVEGEPELEIEFKPRPDYARRRPRIESAGALGWRCRLADELLLLSSDVDLKPNAAGDALTGRVRLHAGERRHLSLSYTKRDIATIPLLNRSADARLTDTRLWWRAWSGQCSYQGPYRNMVQRSAQTLKLMDYALSGAVLAAPTASLPEHIGGSRNWDYRFCWLRDAGFTFRCFMDLGYPDEAYAFIGWLLHSTRLTWPRLQVLYAAHGEADIGEYELGHLTGYRQSKPVRIGNAAQRQLQLDVYGEVVLAAYDYVTAGGRLDFFEARMLVGLGRTVCRSWRQPDESIWEIRGEPRHYTYSKLMCWVALDRLLKLHAIGQVRAPVALFRRERAAVHAAIEERAFDSRLNSYVATFDGSEPDASLLLMARRGYLDGRDPRMLGTFAYIQHELGRDGLIYRYPPGYDNMPEPEGSFTACSFWGVLCLVEQGRVAQARERYEYLLGLGNDLGLYGEEIDVASGRARGNFPQAYSHVALIECALALDRGETGSKTT